MFGVYLAGMVAAFLLGNLRDPVLARVGLVVVLGSAATIIYNVPDHKPGELLFIPLLFGIAWLAGFALHTRTEQADAAEARAAQAERERESAARLAVAEERDANRPRAPRHRRPRGQRHGAPGRGRPAQAPRRRSPTTRTRSGASSRRAVPRSPRCAASWGRCAATATTSSSRPSRASTASSRSREEVERAGLPVRLHVEGEPVRLPRAIDLSAYRIVQEGLTNALKHARASHADVTLRYAPDEVRIEVRDDGEGDSRSNGPATASSASANASRSTAAR